MRRAVTSPGGGLKSWRRPEVLVPVEQCGAVGGSAVLDPEGHCTTGVEVPCSRGAERWGLAPARSVTSVQLGGDSVDVELDVEFGR